MKKAELKDLIKECVREVVFESGVIRSIVTEVAQGLGTSTLVEGKTNSQTSRSQQKDVKNAVREQIARSLSTASIENSTSSPFSNNPLFKGTKPLQESVNNPGVDITSLPGIQNWANIANKTDRKG